MRKKAVRYSQKCMPSLVLFVFCFFTEVLWAQQQKILIVTEQWAPYNYMEDDLLKGFSVEIIQHIIRDINADAELKIYPSMRATLLLNTRPRTMLISMLRTPEREERYQWVGPLGEAAIYFYKKKDSPLIINSLEDAKQVELIASRHAGLVFNILTKAGFTNLDTTATKSISVYQKLLLERCDLGISDSSLGVNYILQQLGKPRDALIQVGPKVVGSQLYIATSKDIPASELALWQASLDKMKTSGLYEQLYRKYSGEP